MADAQLLMAKGVRSMTTRRIEIDGIPCDEAEVRRTAADHAMARCAAGDDSAFGYVASVVSPRLIGLLGRLSGSRDLAQDLTQNTLLCMYRARATFVPGSSVTPWAYAIARNCYASDSRRKGPRVLGNRADLAEIRAHAGADGDAESSLRALESAHIVERALAAMPLANREAFVLLRYEALSLTVAARIVGVSQGCLKLRAFRAYEMLRAALRSAENC